MKKYFLFCFCFFLTGSLWADQWLNILREPLSGNYPQPQNEVVWRKYLGKALQEAQKTNRPLFVTFRCLPCKQCSDFDRVVLAGSPQLTPWLKHFITVRLTDARRLNLEIFDIEGYQDLDLSWWGYFLSPKGETYSVFGGRDHVSDKTRISEKALVNTLKRVLDHHYNSKRPSWKIDGRKPRLSRWRSPTKLAGFSSWIKERKYVQKQSCLHCHQVAEVLREPAIRKGTFRGREDLQMWPLPENVGIVLNRDHGLKVDEVKAQSPAEQIGLRKGDILAAAEDQKLFGQTDFRGVLHRGPPEDGSLKVYWFRGENLHFGSLDLEKGWRATELSWRASVADGNIGMWPGFGWPLKGPHSGKGKMSIRPWMGNKPNRLPAFRAGLRGNHVVIAVNGESPDLFGRPFMAWFRLAGHKEGDSITLTVLEKGQERDISYILQKPME